MCPKGDDPITLNQNKYTFELALNSLSTSNTLSGDLILHFQDEHISLPIDSAFNNASCANAFLSSQKMNNVSCLYQNNSRTSITLRVTVNSWPLFPQQNNIFTHNGVPSLADFTCDSSKMDSPVSCTFSPVFTSNIEGIPAPLMHFPHFPLLALPLSHSLSLLFALRV
jgi:hypothetical protein